MDTDLREIGTWMIAPNCKNRKRKTQDECPLQRYKRRRKAGRTMGWLRSFRRVRDEHDEYKVQHLLG